MLQRLSNPKSAFAWWLAFGLLLGLYFAQLVGSYAVALPMGIALSLVMGKAGYRVSRRLTR
jgi:hypothetical protein